MDEFLEAMFTIACKWQHGKDVQGEAAEKLRNGEITADDYDDYIMKTQTDNLKDMKQSCGMIVAKGKAKCRTGCGDRWGSNMAEKGSCDTKCVTVYDRFEKECETKADHLESVYAIKLKQTAIKQQCYEGWCSEFPQVWMMDETAAKAEVDNSCVNRCTPTNVQYECDQEWRLEVDFIRASVTSSCNSQGQVETCFNTKKETASATESSCSQQGNSTCSQQFETCKTQGNVGNSPAEAEAFCIERKKMCEAKSWRTCHEAFVAELDSAKIECEQADASSLNTCVEDGMTTQKNEHSQTCLSEKSTSCNADCHQKCQVDEMMQCLAETKAEADPADDFCKDFWRLLHETSEVDPVTGNPIVFISTKSEVTKVSA